MTGAARLSRTRTCSCVPARPSRAICVVLPVWHLHRRKLPVRVVPPMHGHRCGCVPASHRLRLQHDLAHQEDDAEV